MVPNPTYPIHIYGVTSAGANVVSIPLSEKNDFIPDISSYNEGYVAAS